MGLAEMTARRVGFAEMRRKQILEQRIIDRESEVKDYMRESSPELVWEAFAPDAHKDPDAVAKLLTQAVMTNDVAAVGRLLINPACAYLREHAADCVDNLDYEPVTWCGECGAKIEGQCICP